MHCAAPGQPADDAFAEERYAPQYRMRPKCVSLGEDDGSGTRFKYPGKRDNTEDEEMSRIPNSTERAGVDSSAARPADVTRSSGKLPIGLRAKGYLDLELCRKAFESRPARSVSGQFAVFWMV
ncbi:hypothetical protein MHYP_G00314990 [Metynnis hypsauchen]